MQRLAAEPQSWANYPVMPNQNAILNPQQTRPQTNHAEKANRLYREGKREKTSGNYANAYDFFCRALRTIEKVSEQYRDNEKVVKIQNKKAEVAPRFNPN